MAHTSPQGGIRSILAIRGHMGADVNGASSNNIAKPSRAAKGSSKNKELTRKIPAHIDWSEIDPVTFSDISVLRGPSPGPSKDLSIYLMESHVYGSLFKNGLDTTKTDSTD